MSNIKDGKTADQKALLYVTAIAKGDVDEAGRIFDSVDWGEDFNRFCNALEEYHRAVENDAPR